MLILKKILRWYLGAHEGRAPVENLMSTLRVRMLKPLKYPNQAALRSLGLGSESELHEIHGL